MNVKLISITPDSEKIIAYCARVSSPHQDNEEFSGLLKYCMTHGHWSIFEMANMCVEIETSRAIAQQILRHRSFSFQEFSQRYAEALTYETYEARRQDTKNRQNSIDDMPQETKDWFKMAQNITWQHCHELYGTALGFGIAKEQARFLLPLNTQTKLYMNGSVRSWIHYFKTRLEKGTQLEHRQIAEKIFEIFTTQMPIIGSLVYQQVGE